jgi:hypothetical protein
MGNEWDIPSGYVKIGMVVGIIPSTMGMES